LPPLLRHWLRRYNFNSTGRWGRRQGRQRGRSVWRRCRRIWRARRRTRSV